MQITEYNKEQEQIEEKKQTKITAYTLNESSETKLNTFPNGWDFDGGSPNIEGESNHILDVENCSSPFQNKLFP